ncbi:MAG TPA: hypothetical protein VHM90_20385, partial [Phycisphaerae bacterium]|nr:hypothetical protein [Phycisphaerae bacterium]
GVEVPNFAEIIILGQSEDDEATGIVDLYVWTHCNDSWVAFIVAQFHFHLGMTTGTTGSAAASGSDQFADTYTLDSPVYDADVVSIHSPGSSVPGRVTIDLRGAQKLQLVRADSVEAITNVKALVRGF